MSILLNSDSYKHSHHLQLPPGTKRISSYIEARVGNTNVKQVTQFFGLQAFLRKYLREGVNLGDANEAGSVMTPHGLPFNDQGWRRIARMHRGYLPLEIQALPEGTIVPRGVPLVQVVNTDDELPWLTSFIETPLLRGVWYPSSVATQSFLLKAVIYDALVTTCDDPDSVAGFRLHDFGARGVSSGESAALGGMAHLVNFMGTDTIEGMLAAEEFYDAQSPVGFSIPASEHSTMTAWGPSDESEAYANMIERFGDGMFSIVSDSYDLWNAVGNIFGGVLKPMILGMKGTLVVRPDSGDPITTPLRVLDLLWEKFGGTTNSKGYKVLNPKVRVIQGDGMSANSIGILLASLISARWSVENIAFGMGGQLLQGHMRDDMRFAMKANAIDYGGGWVDLQKKPATDPTKASKAGRQAVIRRHDGELMAIREDQLERPEDNMLQVVYRNGEFLNEQTFDQIRERSHREMLAFRDRAIVAPRMQAA